MRPTVACLTLAAYTHSISAKNMKAGAAAARSYLSIAKRYSPNGHLWIWKDGLGGFRGTNRVSGNGESLCHVLTAEDIEVHEDWEPMMSSDVAPDLVSIVSW